MFHWVQNTSLKFVKFYKILEKCMEQMLFSSVRKIKVKNRKLF